MLGLSPIFSTLTTIPGEFLFMNAVRVTVVVVGVALIGSVPGEAAESAPRGQLTQGALNESRLYPGATHEYQVYVPPQFTGTTPAAVMVFQDGAWYAKADGAFRAPAVFDALIDAGAMPVTIAVFVNPGIVPPTRAGAKPQSIRSFEYDSLSDRYARFLVEDLLPVALKDLNVSSDPAQRALCGMSSGGICAFTAAWQRPDRFGRVMSHIGSFTNIRGGDVYPALIRKTEPKPIRVYLEDASGDLDNLHGSWPLANQEMAAALEFMGYDVRFDYAEGFGHNGKHGAELFRDALTWLWRNEAHETAFDVSAPLGGDRALRRQLIPGEGWSVVADGLGFADASCTDAQGHFYFCDMKAPAVYRVSAADGARETLTTEAVSGLDFGPDGRLYGCQGGKQRVIAIDTVSGKVEVIATGVAPNDLAITPDGFLFFTDTKAGDVKRVVIATGEVTVAAQGLAGPNGIALTRDGGTLAVSEYRGEHVWTFRVNPDGTLDAGMPTMTLRRGDGPEARGDGMAVDATDRYYVTSAVGIQIFDPTGRLSGVMATPDPAKPLTSSILAGPSHEYLYVTNGDTIFRRRLKID
jgi:sugar lactone lactonase YvrE/enterochelin esterase-like enzyme